MINGHIKYNIIMEKLLKQLKTYKLFNNKKIINNSLTI